MLIKTNLLSYTSRLDSRDLSEIDLVVIHCTELPDISMARDYGERIIYPQSQTGNSGHFYIEQNGNVERWVTEERVAHHVRDYNHRSIGIELDNVGRFPNWFDSRNQEMTEHYTLPQIHSLVELLKELQQRLPSLRWIAGHEALDRSRVAASDRPDLKVFRKRDPGPQFPWQEILPLIPLEVFPDQGPG